MIDLDRLDRTGNRASTRESNAVILAFFAWLVLGMLGLGDLPRLTWWLIGWVAMTVAGLAYFFGRNDGERREHQRATTEEREREQARREHNTALRRRPDHLSDWTN